MNAVTPLTLSRRTAVRAGAGGIVAALTARRPSATATAPSPRATFLLVHGAWAGAWIWKEIAPLLRAAGHDVFATTATGMGDLVHLARPDIGLDTFVADAVNLLAFEDLRGVTLVGWSFGGMTITGVAERVPERLKQVVYLDAFVPADGQSANDLLPLAEAAAGTPGFLPVAGDLVRSLTKDPADRDWLFAKLVPQPLPSFTQPIKLANPAAAAVPRAYVACTENAVEVFAQTAARVGAEAGWRIRELADNHLAPVNNPQATAEALLSLV